MSDTALNKIIQYGTRAARTAFTPSPASGSQVLYLWYETDHAPDVWAWDGSAWQQINAGGSGTVTNTGTLTAGQIIEGNGGTDIKVGDLSGDVTTSGSLATTVKSNLKEDTITFTIDGAGSAVTTGLKKYWQVPFDGTIQSVSLAADQSGSIVIDIWKDIDANFPPTVADTITASDKPTLSSAQKSIDSTLTGWTTSFSAGDWFAFHVDSASTLTWCVLQLKVLRS